MTVEELMEELSRQPPTREVWVGWSGRRLKPVVGCRDLHLYDHPTAGDPPGRVFVIDPEVYVRPDNG
jgi:hypothetical protein